MILPDQRSCFPDGIKPDLAVALPPEEKQDIFQRSLTIGMAPFVLEADRPHFNEAALLAGTNPEIDAAQAAERRRARGGREDLSARYGFAEGDQSGDFDRGVRKATRPAALTAPPHASSRRTHPVSVSRPAIADRGAHPSERGARKAAKTFRQSAPGIFQETQSCSSSFPNISSPATTRREKVV